MQSYAEKATDRQGTKQMQVTFLEKKQQLVSTADSITAVI